MSSLTLHRRPRQSTRHRGLRVFLQSVWQRGKCRRAKRQFQNSDLVVAKTDRGHRVATQWVFQELAMAITAQVIATAVMRGVGNFVGQFRHAFQGLMQLAEIVDVFFDFLIDTDWMIIKRIVDGGLNFNLHDIPGLINGVDRSLAAIAGVMDHDGPSNRMKDARRDQPDADQKEGNKK
jgi:hypothetical protein